MVRTLASANTSHKCPDSPREATDQFHFILVFKGIFFMSVPTQQGFLTLLLYGQAVQQVLTWRGQPGLGLGRNATVGSTQNQALGCPAWVE